MDNVVIYARFSSSKQQEQSIDGQLRYCREYAERNGYRVIGEYCDRAISGKTDKRPQFQKMIEDSASKRFKYVLVWKFDRFSRDRYAAALYKHKLKKNGVKVVSVTESIGEGSESIILEAMLEAMAELYVTQLSENVKRGAREAALKGNNVGGVIPFGYDSINKKLVVNEKQAMIVREAFQLYAAGTQIKDIVAEFNEKGYMMRNGRPFNRETFHCMFQNEKYIGVFHYDDIRIEGGCPAIVDKETFDKCRKRAKANKREKVGKPSKTDYLLKGKAFCGYCSSSIVGDSGTSKTGVRHEYYSCSKRKKEKNCIKLREKKGYLEWYVVEQTVLYVLQPDRLEYISNRVAEVFNESIDVSDELADLKSQRAALEREFQKLVDKYINTSSPHMIESINKRADEIDALLNELDAQIVEAEGIMKYDRLEPEDIKKWLKGFCNGDPLDEKFQRRVIDVLVNSVYIYDDKIVIYFNVRDGKQVSYMQMIDETSYIFDNADTNHSQGSSSIIDTNRSPSPVACQRDFCFLTAFFIKSRCFPWFWFVSYRSACYAAICKTNHNRGIFYEKNISCYPLL